MKKILLVSPDFNPKGTVSSIHSRLRSLPFVDAKAYMVPLGLATVAALTPDDIEVDIWDEAVRGPIDDSTIFEKSYDIAGITGYSGHTGRMNELGSILNRRGLIVAIGGPGVSAAPEHYSGNFDVLFIGEAEYTWPKFIADWKTGSYRSEYRQVSKVDMTHSPLPIWDSVVADLDRYLIGAVQTTRGCPFDCEFCDVIYIYGRQARHKEVEQVLEEVKALERLGVNHIFLCDDNFMGNPRYGKALLKELIRLNNSFKYPLGFHTQITLNVAKDDEMLELLADCNFIGLFIGIESPNVESLIEANKPQNYKTNIVEDVKKIQSYALPVQGSMIVGFDHDDTSIFKQQFDFIQESGLPNPGVTILQAPIGTKLWVRLHSEKRVLKLRDEATTLTASHETNIIPKGMTRLELFAGYRDLVRQVRDWRNFEARLKNMISQVQRRPNVRRNRRPWKLTLRFIKFVLFSVGKDARGPILRSLLYTLRRAPFMIDRVVRLIARQYVEAVRVESMTAALDEQIRLELQDGMKLQTESTVFFVPESFKKPYKDVFPGLYQQVYRGLTDKSRTQDALVEVVYDFLTRWGPTFQQFEEHHRSAFSETCDRTIAKENDNVQNSAAVQEHDELAALSEGHAKIWLNRLADDVMKNVEMQMRTFQLPPAEQELETVVS